MHSGQSPHDERERRESWFVVEQIDADTFAIGEPGHWENVRSYLLVGTERAALVDSGTGIGDIAAVVRRLTRLPVTVLTTHVHWDHIGGHGAFDDIRVHELDVEWLRSGIGLPLEMMRRDLMRDPFLRNVPDTFRPEEWSPPLVPAPTLIFDGELIKLGGRSLRALHTPGHSPGHLCFYDEARGYLLTGDLLYEGAPIYVFSPTTDPVAFADSIDKIGAIAGIKVVLPGHNASLADAQLVVEAKRAMALLRERAMLYHGSGEHHFERIQVRF